MFNSVAKEEVWHATAARPSPWAPSSCVIIHQPILLFISPIGQPCMRKDRILTEGLLHWTKNCYCGLKGVSESHHCFSDSDSDPFPVKQEGDYVADWTDSEWSWRVGDVAVEEKSECKTTLCGKLHIHKLCSDFLSLVKLLFSGLCNWTCPLWVWRHQPYKCHCLVSNRNRVCSVF